jgi:hypothetical protein
VVHILCPSHFTLFIYSSHFLHSFFLMCASFTVAKVAEQAANGLAGGVLAAFVGAFWGSVFDEEHSRDETGKIVGRFSGGLVSAGVFGGGPGAIAWTTTMCAYECIRWKQRRDRRKIDEQQQPLVPPPAPAQSSA